LFDIHCVNFKQNFINLKFNINFLKMNNILSNKYLHKDSLITAVNLSNNIFNKTQQRLYDSISQSYDTYTREMEDS